MMTMGLRNKKNQQYKQGMALFFIFLIISMTISSANVMAASVQITKNYGQAGMDGVLDASNDIWTVEALISDFDSGGVNNSIDPNDVKIVINKNTESFQTCSSSAIGVVCQYVSPLTGGVKEAAYSFNVIYELYKDVGMQNKNPGASSVIVADGSGPEINFVSAIQNGGDLRLDFSVSDITNKRPSVGLKSIEIFDAQTGIVIDTINNFTADVSTFDYVKDNGNVGKVTLPWKDEGVKTIKILAYDRLGHVSNAAFKKLEIDNVKPVIKDETLQFPLLGKFMGQVIVSSSMRVDVVDTSVISIKAYSEGAKLNGNLGDCVQDADKNDLWHCGWDAVDIKPESTVSVSLVVEDAAGNIVEKVVTKSFVKDSSEPVIDYFGTEHTYNEKWYMAAKSSDQRVILRVKEQGAGMNESGVRLNLKAFGEGIAVAPNECVYNEGGIFECYWSINTISSSSEIKHIGLSKFQDNVGNEGKMPEIEVIVDNDAPKVMKMEVYGKSEIGDKDYFQSNDQLKIKLTAAEVSGLIVVVDMNNLVTDAETKYPITDYTRTEKEGWAVFTDKDCKRDEEAKTWTCVFETAPLRSGPDTAEFKVYVKDTAGNVAKDWQSEPKHIKSGSKGVYTVNLLGLSTESTPDYWSARSKAIGGDNAFVDLDTTQLTNARIPFKITLDTKTSAKILKVELAECKGKDESLAYTAENVSAKGASLNSATVASAKLSRSILYGGKPATEGTVIPTVILEFEPFDGRKLFNLGSDKETFKNKVVDYTCVLRIYSKVGTNALQSAELQEVKVKVPFGFSTLGAEDENLNEIIAKEREAVETGLWGAIGKINKVLKWIDYIMQLVNTGRAVISLFETNKYTTEGMEAIPAVGKAGRLTACFGLSTGTGVVDESLGMLDIPLQILTCRKGADNWYGKWQAGILAWYNLEGLHTPFDTGESGVVNAAAAHDLKDNVFLSAIGLCVPGIVKNLDKYRQIKCRKIYCLQSEVKANLATVADCNKLEHFLTCKYFWGELYYLVPFTKLYDTIITTVWTALKDPFALLHTVFIVGCTLQCTYSSTASATCSYATYIWKWIDILESIASLVTTVIEDVKSGGLEYCDSVLK